MASQKDTLESNSFKQCTLGGKSIDVPDSDKSKRSRDSKSPVAKKPKQEPLRIGQLRDDVQAFIRKDAAERNLPGPLYQQKLSESLGTTASASAAASTMETTANPTASCTKEQAGSPPDEKREDDLLRAIIDESGTPVDNGEKDDIEVLPEPKASRDKREKKGSAEGQNYECEAESQVSPDSCAKASMSIPPRDSSTPCQEKDPASSVLESRDIASARQQKAVTPPSIQPSDGVPKAENELNDEKVYALIHEIHIKFDTMALAVGEPGGPSINRVRSLLAELPTAVCDMGDLPNIQKDISQKQRLGKHQMRELLRRIGFFCVFLENKYMAKIADKCS